MTPSAPAARPREQAAALRRRPKSPGAQVITWPAAASGANQQWTFQDGLLVSGLGGNVLDLAGTEAGAALVINPPS